MLCTEITGAGFKVDSMQFASAVAINNIVGAVVGDGNNRGIGNDNTFHDNHLSVDT